MKVVSLKEALEYYRKSPDSVFIQHPATKEWHQFKSFYFSTEPGSISADKLARIFEANHFCYVGVIFEGKPLWSGDGYLPEEPHTKLYTPCITTEALYVEVPRMNNNTEVLRLHEARLLYQDWEEAQRVGQYLLSTIQIP